VVIIDGKILNKPSDEEEAISMLKTLSGKMHLVVTGISIKIGDNYETHADVAEVYFDNLTDEEICYYVKKHKPFDKAGSYGVQDFIGMIGIPKINGSFYTVMGLPIHLVYQSLKKYMVL
jgi:septum formation protein